MHIIIVHDDYDEENEENELNIGFAPSKSKCVSTIASAARATFAC